MRTKSSKTVASIHNARICPAGSQVRSFLVSIGRIWVTRFAGLSVRVLECITDKNDCANLWICKVLVAA
jgi:hypothetical protein